MGLGGEYRILMLGFSGGASGLHYAPTEDASSLPTEPIVGVHLEQQGIGHAPPLA
jgi:hypothetical protein